MKRMIPLVLLAFIVALPVAATAQTTTPDRPVYTVQPGDTLYWLEGMSSGDPTQWRRIVELNPFLRQPGRIYEKGGRTIALIKPGEELAGLDQLGILPSVVPISELDLSQYQGATTGNATNVADVSVTSSDWFLGLLIAITVGAALLITYWYFFHFRRQAASAAGTPMVEGGIPPTEPERVTARLDTVARQQYIAVNPVATEMPRRVGEIEHGFLSGTGRVQYRDRAVERHMNREPAYRARYQFPGQTDAQMVHFLQICGNDVAAGTHYMGFAWEPRQVVAASPPPPAPVVPLHPATAADAPGHTRVTVGMIQLLVPYGFAVTHDTDDRIRIAAIGPGEISVGIVPRTAKKPKRAKSAVPSAAETR